MKKKNETDKAAENNGRAVEPTSCGKPAGPGGSQDAKQGSDKELEELRKEINSVDSALVDLLNRRAGLSLAVGEHKRQFPDSVVFHPGRESSLLQDIAGNSSGPLPEEHLRAIYREILSSSRSLQRPQRAAFLGPEGTFSHMAGRAFLGSQVTFHAQPTLVEVFQSVENGDCDLGIVPLENSLQGSVGQSFDLFMSHQVHITAEKNLRIRQSLLSRCHELSEIRVVYSHPQPLAQCSGWLMRNLPKVPVLPLESTAASARRVVHEEGAAAIAHSDLASVLDLHLLAQGIEDQPGNWTRFVLIGLKPADRPGADKTSVLFSVADKPGSLNRVLERFSQNRINLRKLESRPMQGESWKYVFFADLECDIYDKSYAGVLEEVKEHCLYLRVLGCYPSHF